MYSSMVMLTSFHIHGKHDLFCYACGTLQINYYYYDMTMVNIAIVANDKRITIAVAWQHCYAMEFSGENYTEIWLENVFNWFIYYEFGNKSVFSTFN